MKCFYHCDMDGRCAGAVVARFCNSYDLKDFFEVNYIQPLPLDKVEDGEDVYFVDYSFKADTVWQLDVLLGRNCKVVWIDHHTSSLKLELTEGYDWTNEIKGIRSEDYSGAVLTYMYLYNCKYEEVPYFIKFVGDYDTWSYKFEPYTTHFKLGIETYDFDACDVIWDGLLKSNIGNDNIDNLLNEVLYKGKMIKGYVDKDNTIYRNRFEYEIELCGLACKVINKSSNSWVFGSHYEEYPIVMVWAFDGEKVTHSIFSNDKTVDCSKIAESYGGGGHRGAAGFPGNDILFRAGGKYGFGPYKK